MWKRIIVRVFFKSWVFFNLIARFIPRITIILLEWSWVRALLINIFRLRGWNWLTFSLIIGCFAINLHLPLLNLNRLHDLNIRVLAALIIFLEFCDAVLKILRLAIQFIYEFLELFVFLFGYFEASDYIGKLFFACAGFHMLKWIFIQLYFGLRQVHFSCFFGNLPANFCDVFS